MNVVYIDDSRQLEWESLTKTNPASGYMQSFFWTKFKNLLGWQSYKIGITEHNTLIGGAIISKYSHLKRRNFLQISEGPVLPYDHPTKAAKMFELLICEIDTIVDLSGDSLTSHLSIEPKLSHVPLYFSKFRKAPVDQQPVRTLLVDLRESEEELLLQMKPKGRYNIKVAKKHHVHITKMPLQEGINDFLAIYKPFVKQSGFAGKQDDYFLCLADLVPSMKEAAFFVATYNGNLLSSAIVLYYGDTATFLYGASSYDDRNLMAPYLLHWEIIRDAQSRGFTWYDFYSLAPGKDTTSHPWHGFSVFKRKFGGVEINYIGGHDFVYNEEVYERYLQEDVGIKI